MRTITETTTQTAPTSQEQCPFCYATQVIHGNDSDRHDCTECREASRIRAVEVDDATIWLLVRPT